MLRATYIFRSPLRILAPIAACVCILFASSSAWALICQEDAPGGDPALSTPLPAPPLGADEIKTTPSRKVQACTSINLDECKWSLPDGHPRPAPDLVFHKTAAAHSLFAMSFAPRAAQSLATEVQGPGPHAAFLARIFRPPRKS